MLLDSIDRQILNLHRTGKEKSFSGARLELHLATLNLRREIDKPLTRIFNWIIKWN